MGNKPQPIDQYTFWGNLAKVQKVKKTFSNYGYEYEVELKITWKIFSEDTTKQNIVHIISQDVAMNPSTGLDDVGKFGCRTPAIYFGSGKWYIRAGLNDEKDTRFTIQATDKDHVINVSQRKYGDKYIFKIVIDGVTKEEIEQTKPMRFDKVDVYLSSYYTMDINENILLHYVKIYQWA